MFVKINEMKNNNEIICLNEKWKMKNEKRKTKNNKEIIWELRFNGDYLDVKIKI